MQSIGATVERRKKSRFSVSSPSLSTTKPATPLRILTATWNVGNKKPDADELAHWLPEGGEGYELVAIGKSSQSSAPSLFAACPSSAPHSHAHAHDIRNIDPLLPPLQAPKRTPSRRARLSWARWCRERMERKRRWRRTMTTSRRRRRASNGGGAAEAAPGGRRRRRRIGASPQAPARARTCGTRCASTAWEAMPGSWPRTSRCAR